MNTKFYLPFLLAVCIVGFVSAKPQAGNCGPNNVLCLSECQVTCASPNPAGFICVMPCVAGCVCPPGYLLNDQDICVLPEDC
ncbi:chymotrypsin inhibitor-like [Zeugodacus cucurbitae]|uniref:chymotrypsin inhibitor-like n=1 Tax=Zeugodacus cucurbitae TaxID=28588 RepID=UPI000596A47E|nr:chymotrypsin inhibitor-like [Zeugodacus cucurbitae]